MARRNGQSVTAALILWLGIIGVGAWGQRFLPARRNPVAADQQRSALLRSQIEVLEKQRAVAAKYGNIGTHFRPVPAHLLPLELSPRRRGAHLNVGLADGVQQKQVVVCESGVVGIVGEVGQHHSWVMLSDDPEFRVLYRASDHEARGIARGGPGPLQMRSQFHMGAAHYQVGDAIVTAGGDGWFPPGLLLGTVVEVNQGGQEIVVALPHDPTLLAAVVVLTVDES